MEQLVFFSDNQLHLKRYPYNNFLLKRRIFSSNEINFVKINPEIIYVCVNSREILFIPTDYKIPLKQFVEQYSIKTITAIDVWELICFPFLDATHTTAEIEENFSNLHYLSFEKEEVVRIRKKISGIMRFHVTMTLEFASLTHQDVLQARKNLYAIVPFYSKFYWYTMEIALRGYNRQLDRV